MPGGPSRAGVRNPRPEVGSRFGCRTRRRKGHAVAHVLPRTAPHLREHTRPATNSSITTTCHNPSTTGTRTVTSSRVVQELVAVRIARRNEIPQLDVIRGVGIDVRVQQDLPSGSSGPTAAGRRARRRASGEPGPALRRPRPPPEPSAPPGSRSPAGLSQSSLLCRSGSCVQLVLRCDRRAWSLRGSRAHIPAERSERQGDLAADASRRPGDESPGANVSGLPACTASVPNELRTAIWRHDYDAPESMTETARSRPEWYSAVVAFGWKKGRTAATDRW